LCTSRPIESQGGLFAAIRRGPALFSGLRALSLVFIFGAMLGILFAQSNREEYDLVKNYSLPKQAVPVKELAQADSVWLRGSQPFTGFAFDRYNNGQLARIFACKDGLQEGLMYLWYPDGSPQMSANYRLGRLHGRFLGWYLNGGVIYDMVINHSGYAGDYIEDNGARVEEDTPDTDQEGNEQDFERE
jgi:antitoxin component YwqK of YwqJK toxin-antitoxin module